MTVPPDLRKGRRPMPANEISMGLRIAVSTVIGLIGGVVTLLLWSPVFSLAIAWDVMATVLLIWLWRTIWPMNPEATASHASLEDPTQPTSDITLILCSLASLAAVALFLLQAGSAKGAARDVVTGIGVLTVAVSWVLVHTVYTLRYARLYHSGHQGGIDFNQSTPPRYSDFAYLAFTLGMTYQVSDTDLKTPLLRVVALRHAILSYIFGAVIIATTINLVASLGSSH